MVRQRRLQSPRVQTGGNEGGDKPSGPRAVEDAAKVNPEAATPCSQPLFTPDQVRQMEDMQRQAPALYGSLLQQSPSMSQGFVGGLPAFTPQRPSFLDEEEKRMLFRVIQEERFHTQRAHDEFLKEIQKLRDENYCLRMELQDGRRFHTPESSNLEELDGIAAKSRRESQEDGRVRRQVKPIEEGPGGRQGSFKEDGPGGQQGSFKEDGPVGRQDSLKKDGPVGQQDSHQEDGRDRRQDLLKKDYIEDWLEVEDGPRGRQVKGEGSSSRTFGGGWKYGSRSRSRSKEPIKGEAESVGVHDKSLEVMALMLQSMQRRSNGIHPSYCAGLAIPSLTGLEMGRSTWEIGWFCWSPSCPISPQIRNFGGSSYFKNFKYGMMTT